MQYLSLTIAAAVAAFAAAECPNACSGHGTCGDYDSCVCYHNWQAADCSERTCQFGLAHVDTPKGDLDGDRAIEMAGNPSATVVSGGDVYAKGTSEAYPHMFEYVPTVDLASLAETPSAATNYRLSNTAHDYMECSNKGVCNREVGECECFPGYEGSACQRASCPNRCSGHGVCKTIAALEDDASGAPYTLWDKDITMGCKCDGGWSGPDCSSRDCPVGVDPMYLNGNRVYSFPAFRFKAAAAASQTMSGMFTITFFDRNGRGYTTDPIAAVEANPCAGVLPKIKALPNHVVSDDTVCEDISTQDSDDKMEFVLEFRGNPGYHPKSPALNTNVHTGSSSSVTNMDGRPIVAPYNSLMGEDVDYFATECAGVSITVAPEDTGAAFGGEAGKFTFQLTKIDPAPSAAVASKLKVCLGDNDNDADNNVEVSNWDKGLVQNGDGSLKFPSTYVHLVRLVAAGAADGTDGSQIVPIWFDGATFRVMTRVKAGTYKVFTTSGTAKMIHGTAPYETSAVADAAAQKAGTVDALDFVTATEGSALVETAVDVNCDHVAAALGAEQNTLIADRDYVNEKRADHVKSNKNDCVKQGDLVMLADVDIDVDDAAHDASYAEAQTNMLYKVRRAFSTKTRAAANKETPIKHYIELDHAAPVSGKVVLVKFTPHHKLASPARDAGYGTGEYMYVSQCSGRGVCDSEQGLCQCFKGYYMENCDLQSALAI